MKLHVAYTALSIAFSMLFSCAHTQFVFAQWEFLKFNVLEGQSALFGIKPWHWSVRECAQNLGYVVSILY